MEQGAGYATQNDLQLLCKVFADILSEIPYYNALAKENEQKKYAYHELVKKLEEDPSSLLVIKDKENIAGFCFNKFDDYTIWLEWFGVENAYRGKGLSGILLRKLEESARLRHCHKIWCDTRTENKKAITILLENGYENIARIEKHWYSQDFYLWQKFVEG